MYTKVLMAVSSAVPRDSFEGYNSSYQGLSSYHPRLNFIPTCNSAAAADLVGYHSSHDLELQVISDQVMELEPLGEPPLGAHVVTPRRWYTHHAIYVGCGRVVQYGGLARGLRRGPVEEVAMEEFARGYPIWIRAEHLSEPEQSEVVRRARLRLGEDRYDLLTNNCEHFCEWCIRGVSRSHQVERVIARIQRFWNGLGERCGAWLVRRSRTSAARRDHGDGCDIAHRSLTMRAA